MQAHSEIVLLGSGAERIDQSGAVIGRASPPTEGAELRRILGRANPFIHSTVMMRSAVVRKLGGYRAAFRAAEDYDLWLRLAELGEETAPRAEAFAPGIAVHPLCRGPLRKVLQELAPAFANLGEPAAAPAPGGELSPETIALCEDLAWTRPEDAERIRLALRINAHVSSPLVFTRIF